jgi:hypothetical protein
MCDVTVINVNVPYLSLLQIEIEQIWFLLILFCIFILFSEKVIISVFRCSSRPQGERRTPYGLICLSVRMIQLENRCPGLGEIWYELYAVRGYCKVVFFSFDTLGNANLADERHQISISTYVGRYPKWPGVIVASHWKPVVLIDAQQWDRRCHCLNTLLRNEGNRSLLEEFEQQ